MSYKPLTRLDQGLWRNAELGFQLDYSGAVAGDGTLRAVDLEAEAPAWAKAFEFMAALEAGAVANPDERRRVGHYWLRAPDLAPDGLGAGIDAARAACRAVAAEAHASGQFDNALILGIGGSALGPQLIADALAQPTDRLRLHFLDNTDPDGFARVLAPLDLARTLVVCISKSGGTAETRNALLHTQAAYARARIDFASRAVAVSGEGSALWRSAEGWRARLPMWDWVGGRTSLCSAVGLLPMELQGVDTNAFLRGAAAMDVATRVPTLSENPAALLAAVWYRLAEGRARRAMVVLPYRDRLSLLSRYLQQLIMESLGKAHDLEGREVHQGLTVYGNKGSTDQHAYVQQLRDGPDDHFVCFVGVLDDGACELGGTPVEVEPGLDSADFLQGFMLGTRAALRAQGHGTLSLLLERVDAFRMGALTALFERAVGLYAARVGINAYHQPGVEAGKRAATAILSGKAALLAALSDSPEPIDDIAARAGVTDVESAWFLLSRLAANGRGVRVAPGPTPSADRFARGG